MHNHEKSLDRTTGPVLYKTVRAVRSARGVNRKTFNDDDKDLQRAFDEMAAERRHIYRRLLVGSNVINAQHF